MRNLVHHAENDGGSLMLYSVVHLMETQRIEVALLYLRGTDSAFCLCYLDLCHFSVRLTVKHFVERHATGFGNAVGITELTQSGYRSLNEVVGALISIRTIMIRGFILPRKVCFIPFILPLSMARGFVIPPVCAMI